MKKSAVFIMLLGALLWQGLVACAEEEKALGNVKTDASPGKESEQYKVVVGDTLNITVYQEPDLSGSFEVKEDGRISYPLLGQVEVKELSKREIEKKISALLEKDYLVDPYVTVNITSYNKRQALLLGHVQKPGAYDFPEGRNLTLLEVITQAGGFTGYAAASGTKIIRVESDNNKVVIDPRVNDIISGRKKDIELKPGDLIIVPERLF